MTNEFAARLKAVNQTVLTPLVRSALENDAAKVVDWSCQAVTGGFSQTVGHSYGIYRFQGAAQILDKRVPWSLILKAIGSSSTGSQEPSDWSYWKREVLVFQCGLLDDLAGDLVAPRCFAVDEYPGQEFWIWLEDIPEPEEATWSLERYGLAARHLGQFNGPYFVGRPLPEADWLSSGRVRSYLARAKPIILDLPTISKHPLAQHWLTRDSVERIQQLWADQDRLLAGFDRLPKSLCHLDAYRGNLLTRRGIDGREQTVAIDWSIAGIGAIGEEIAPLFVQSLQYFEVDMKQMRKLDKLVFEGYLTGLRDVGWQCDPQMVRFGYTATLALYKGVGFVGFVLSLVLNDEGMRHSLEKSLGYPLEYVFGQWAELQHYLLDLGDEARELRAILA